MSQLSDVVQEVMRGLMPMIRPAGGWIRSHLRDVAGLPPEVAQLDAYTFEGTIGGSTLTQPGIQKIPGGYYGELMGYSGYISQPGVAVDNFPRITWNLRQQGKRNVFGVDQSMAAILNILGPTPPVWFPRSFYRFDAGADISLSYTRGSSWNTSGDNRTVGVVLYFGLVAADRKDMEK